MHLRKIGTKSKFQKFEGKVIKNMFCRDLKTYENSGWDIFNR